VFDNNQRIQIEEKERNYTERRTINDWHDAPMVSVGSLATHRAVGGPRIFAIGHDYPSPVCAVARIVNEALEGLPARGLSAPCGALRWCPHCQIGARLRRALQRDSDV
jgi:hypothetical protein